MTTVTSVDELRRAWRALEAGQFRSRSGPGWVCDHEVVTVLGCHGGAGGTTLALALATVASRPARVVEACGVTTSGLAAAASAELGGVGGPWLRGTRGPVVVDRVGEPLGSPAEVPDPVVAAVELTVVDAGWDPSALFFSDGWVSRLAWAGGGLVLVARATVPSMRHLETTLHLLGEEACPVVAAIGPRRRRWPRAVQHSLGERTRALDAAGQLLALPEDPALGVRGLDTSDLPGGLLAGAAQILQLIELGSTKYHHTRENPA